MSSTSKIIFTIIIATIVIVGAIMWTNKNKNSQVASTQNETSMQTNSQIANQNKTESNLENPPAATTTPNQSPNETPQKETTPLIATTVSFESTIPTSNWVLAGVILDGKVNNLNENVPQPLTLQFNTKTKDVIGFAGCNSFAGSYITTLNKLSFTGLELGKKNCGQNALENTLIPAMNKITNFTVKSGQLILSSQDNSTKLTYDQAK